MPAGNLGPAVERLTRQIRNAVGADDLLWFSRPRHRLHDLGAEQQQGRIPSIVEEHRHDAAGIRSERLQTREEFRKPIRREHGAVGQRADAVPECRELIIGRDGAQGPHRSRRTVRIPDHRGTGASGKHVEDTRCPLGQGGEEIVGRREFAQHRRIGERVPHRLALRLPLQNGVKAGREETGHGGDLIPYRRRHPVGLTMVSDDEAPQAAILDDRHRHGAVNADVFLVQPMDG